MSALVSCLYPTNANAASAAMRSPLMSRGSRLESDFRPCKRCTLNPPFVWAERSVREDPTQSSEVTITFASCELCSEWFFRAGFPSYAGALCDSYHPLWASHLPVGLVLSISYHQEGKRLMWSHPTLAGPALRARRARLFRRNERGATSFPGRSLPMRSAVSAVV
jgi:hypothetical protein